MTAFFLLFGVGAVLAFIGKLGGTYVGLAGTLHGFVVVRAVSEDRLPNASSVAANAKKEGA